MEKKTRATINDGKSPGEDNMNYLKQEEIILLILHEAVQLGVEARDSGHITG